MAEAGQGGTFNVAGPPRPFTCAELLRRCPGPVTWVPDQFLLDEGVEPYTEMPLWLPASAGNPNMPIERAVAASLRHLTWTKRFATRGSGRSPSMLPSAGSTRMAASAGLQRLPRSARPSCWSARIG
jgi:hypothetical protein